MIFLFAALLPIVIAILTYWFFIFDDQKHVHSPPKFPYLTRLISGEFDLKKNGPIKLIRRGYEQCGNIFRIRAFNKNINFLIGPEVSKPFFTGSDLELSSREVYHFMIPVFGKGVAYDVPASVMSQQIRQVRNGLNTNFLEVYTDKIVDEAQKYFSAQPEQGQCDIHEKMCELATFSAARCLLGDEIRENVTEGFGPLYEDLSNGVSWISMFSPNFPCQVHRKRDEARKKIYKLFGKIIANRRKTGERPKDFLQSLMESEYRDGKKIKDEEICGMLLSTLFGGQHTSVITTTQAIMLFAKYKDKYMERLMEEQKEVLTEAEGKITLQTLEKMTLQHSWIKETLRLFPPLIVLARYLLVDLQTKDFKIPKGDIVCVSPSVSNRLEEQYKDPDIFDPDRYQDRGEGEGFSFQSFGGGRHKCVGQRFGYVQIEIFFSVFLRMFDWELIDSSQEPQIDYSTIVSKPVHNTFIKFRRKPQSEQLFLK